MRATQKEVCVLIVGFCANQRFQFGDRTLYIPFADAFSAFLGGFLSLFFEFVHIHLMLFLDRGLATNWTEAVGVFRVNFCQSTRSTHQ